MSPDQVLRKRKFIFFHQSQKDNAMYQEADSRDLWGRAEDHNKEITQKFNALGLASYVAMAAFTRYYP